MKPFGVVIFSSPRSLAGVIPQVIQWRVMSGTLVSKTIIEAGDRIIACNGTSDFREVMNNIRVDQVLKLKVKRPKQYSVKVNKGAGLGLSLKYGAEDEYLFIDEIVDGSVAALNKKYEDRQVRVLDSIIRVNGVQESASAMLEEISTSSFLTLTLYRWHSKLELQKHEDDSKRVGRRPLAGKWEILGKDQADPGSLPSNKQTR